MCHFNWKTYIIDKNLISIELLKNEIIYQTNSNNHTIITVQYYYRYIN